MPRQWCRWAAAGTLLAAGLARAQVSYAPARGQSAERAQQDQYACYQRAKQQSGFDPVQAGLGQAPARPGSTAGHVGRGAAVGAAAGLIGGIILRRPVSGAAVGAGVGAGVGAVRGHQAHERAQAQQERVAAYEQAEAECMRFRGYSVTSPDELPPGEVPPAGEPQPPPP